MIKILIKETKLNEQVPYSKSALSKIIKICEDYYNNKTKKYTTTISIPYSEFSWINNDIKKNGLVVFSMLNVLGFPTLPDNVKKLWNSSKKEFDKALVDQINARNFDLTLNLSDSQLAAKIKSETIIKGNKESLKVSMNLNHFTLMQNYKDDMEQMIKHELRHLSQKIPALCQLYGSDLKLLPSIDDVKRRSFILKSSEMFGVGKDITGIKQLNAKEASSVSPHEKLKTYLSSDEEFETWMSDISFYYVRWLDQKKLLTSKKVKQLNIYDLANDLASKLLNDLDLRKKFSRETEEWNYIFIQNALKNRPREFISKLPRYIRDEIKDKYMP